MNIYIGVDGGGTKTEIFALAADTGQAVICSGPASNPGTVGWDSAVRAVNETIARALDAMAASESDIAAVSFCMSGIDRPLQVVQMRSLLANKYAGAKTEIVNDGLAALTAGTAGESGLVLIAGTGSIAVAEGRDGQIARVGGYGNLIGDEGGGFDIGRKGLMAAIQYAEHRGPKTKLWEIACEVFKLEQPGEIISRVYEASHPVGVVSSFARYVLEAAESDVCAEAIVDESSGYHLNMILALRQQLAGNVSDHVVLAGGLFTNSTVLRDRLTVRLQGVAPTIHCALVTHQPCAGAVLRALRLVHGNTQVTLSDRADSADSTDRAKLADTFWRQMWREAVAHASRVTGR